MRRRVFSYHLLALGLSGFIRTGQAGRPAAAFAADAPEEAVNLLFAGSELTDSDAIAISAPALAEDGAIVPIKIRVELPDLKRITVISEKNPVPLLAQFELGARFAGGYLATRVKLAESTFISVFAEAGGKVYRAKRYVTVTKGGCD